MALPGVQQQTEPTRIDYIDAWRFWAVVLVIQSHIFVYSGLKIRLLAPYLDQLDRLGEMGVLIFFVISGFVICSGLVQEKKQTGRICLSAFYLRRVFRILPPLWLYLASLLLLNRFDVIHISPQQALTSFAFLCNMPFPAGCSWYAGHTWTLAYEEQFYLLFPLLLVFGPIIDHNLRFAGAIAVMIVCSIGMEWFGYTFPGEYLRYFIFLFTGCCCALLPKGVMQDLRRLPGFIWLMVIASLLICVNYLPVGLEKLFKTFLYPLLIAFMVLGTPIHVRPISWFFKPRVFCYLGRISYTVYLWQELVTGSYLGWMSLIYLALVFVLAMFSYHYIELPLQQKARIIAQRLKNS